MVRLSDEQVDFILDDLKANGIVLEDLQHNLLDHICCIIEEEITDGEDFYAFYKKVLPRFYQKELKEIQEETNNLLKFKNYYAMKKILNISGIVSALLTILGAVLKTNHLPGAAVCIVLGGGIFSLIFLPLMIALKFKDEEKTTDKWVLSFGFLIAMIISLGVVFKIQHWPYANIMMQGGLSAFVFAYVPLYYLSRIRRPEIRFNTTVNTVLMMACGGMLYGLYNLGFSKKLSDSLAANYEFIDSKKKQIAQVNNAIYGGINQNDTLSEIHKLTSELDAQMENIKFNLIMKAEGLSAEEASLIKPDDVRKPNSYEVVQQHFINVESQLSYSNLKGNFEKYNQTIAKYYPTLEEKKIELESLKIDVSTLGVVLLQITQIQLQLMNNENSLLLAK